MKKLLSILITASMLFSTAVLPASAEDNSVNVTTEFKTSNLIVNGGFENGLEGWVTDGTGVFTVAEDTFIGANNAEKPVVNGKKAVKATVTNITTAGYMYQEVDVTANTNYVLNLSWFHLSNTKGSVKVYGDSMTQENLLANVGNIFGGEVWYSSTAAFNSGEHEKVIIRIDIFNPNPSQYSALYYCVDNITLKAAGNTQTIDFENGYPEDFNMRGAQYAVSDEKAHEGTKSLKLTSGAGNILGNATFALNPNRHFAVMFWCYIESGSLDVVSNFKHGNTWAEYTNNAKTSPITNKRITETGKWVRVILTPGDNVTGTGNNTFVEIAFQNYAKNSVIYIDDIQCKYYDESVDSITITGENELDGTLSADVKAYNYGYNFTDPVSYQWQRSADKTNWVDISGAITEEYVLTEDDSDKYVRLKVNTTNRYSTNVSDAYYSKAILINEFKKADEIVTTFPTSNIMVNGGFEDGLEGWITDNSGAFTLVEDTFTNTSGKAYNVVNGTKALKATVTNTKTEGYIYKIVDVNANTNYVFNLSWFHLANSKGSVKIYGDSMTQENLLANVGNIFGGEVWYSSTAAFNSGEHEKVIIRIDIFNPDKSKYPELYFCVDNITLKAAGNTQTIGFESGYAEDFNIRGKEFAVTTEKAYEGTHSIKLTATSGNPLANVTFALNQNRHYAVMFNYYVESGSIGAVAKHAHENGWSGYTTSPIRAAQTLSGTGEWKRAILTPADGVTGSLNNAFIEIAFQGMAANTVVYIDNIQCKSYNESVDSITITGENKGGGTLHADVKAYNYGYSFEDPVTYQWQRSADKKNWSDIAGATTADYKLTMDDSQKFLRLKVNTSNRYSTTLSDAYYSKAIEINEITIEDIKAQILVELEGFVDAFDANDYSCVTALADAIKLANEYGCDITSISNYAALEAIGLDNFATVTGASVVKAGNAVTIELTLSAPISESFATAENFKVLADRNEVEYTVDTVKNADGKVTSVKLSFTKSDEKYANVYAKFGYVCNFSDILTICDVEITDEIILKNSEGKEINTLTEVTDGVVTGTVKVYAHTAQSVLVAQAIYDGNGSLYSTDLNQVSLTAGQETECTLNLTLPTDGNLDDRFTLKTFVWDAGTFTPFTKTKGADSLNKTYGMDVLNDESKELTVAFLGGSQTQGGYYTTPLVNAWKADRAGGVKAINAGVGGSGTDYGVFRVGNDVISKKPDVVFVEFTLNDMNSDKTMVRKNVEGVIRQLNSSDHVPVIVFIHIPSKNDEALTASIANYNTVLKHYGFTGIDLHSYIKGIVNSGEYTYEEMFQTDGVHLNTLSGNLCAEYIYNAISGENKATYLKNAAAVESLFENSFKNPTLLDPTVACYDPSWTDAEPGNKVMEGYNTPIEQNLFNHYMVTNKENATMTFTFTGDKLLFEGLRGKDGRKIKYEVTNDDGTVVAIGETGNYIAGYNWYKGSYMLLQGLGSGKHTLKVTVLSSEGTGEAFGIGGIWVDEQ